MEVHFYLPERYLPDSDRQEAWRSGKITRLEEGGKIACAQCWIFQTWLALERSGFPAHLTHSMPSDGVLVTLTSCVESDFRASGSRFLCRHRGGLSCPPSRATARRPKCGAREAIVERRFHSALAASQPDSARSGALRTGLKTSVSLAIVRILRAELADERWQRKLKDELGVNFIVCGADRWHDYREADCVAAVRGFGRSAYLHKPATKLYNAWLAGVPFIGGMDSAYAEDGEPGRNFLRAATPDELFEHIRRLKEEPALRDRLVAAGRIAGRNFTSEAILGRWRHFLGDTVQRLAERWQRRGAAARRIFHTVQTASVMVRRTAQALK